MASQSPYRQAVGQYAPDSLAARGPVQIPSSKRRGTAASDGVGYRQAATMGSQNARADKIAAARADGTFDAKRNAYNAANKGSYMDASGKTGPKAEPPVTSPVAPTSPAPTSTATASSSAPVMGPPKPRGPAMFDGKPKAAFFADAARRGVASMPSGVYDQPEIAAKIKSPMAAPSMAAAAADTRGTKQAVAIQGAAKSIADANKIIAENKATRKPMVAAASPSTPMPAKAAATPQASGANFGFARSKTALAPQSPAVAPAAPAPAKTFATAAQTQAQKNPQGLSARMNPPGAKPRGIEDDLLVGNLVKGEMKKLEDLKVVGRKVAGAFKGQAARNPQGFAAKAMRFFGGGNSQPVMATR